MFSNRFTIFSVASVLSVDFTSIQCMKMLSSTISIVSVPGVKVIELVKIMRAMGDFNVVFTSTIPGFIGSDGDKTRLATSKFDFISSKIKTNK